MFYYASKIAWAIVNPVTIVGLLALASCILVFTPWRRLAKICAGAVLGISLVMMTIPVGFFINRAIEDRFPQPVSLPSDVDGIVVLGGPVDPRATQARGIFAVNGAFDRVIAFAELADRFPNAKLVYSGGSHAWIPGIGEAEVVEPLLARMGVDTRRLLLEAKSRNTHQNAMNAHELVQPTSTETWILVTSGYHMPRAMGTFRHNGWPDSLIAYPVDFRLLPDASPTWLSIDLFGRLGDLNRGIHEVLGLTVYYWTDRSDSWFPAPMDEAG